MKQDDKKQNPFIGPRPFGRDPDDQKRFFGRDREAEEIITLVSSHQITLIYAQSGAGKSSILNAQVIPELEKNEFHVVGVARLGISPDIDADILLTSNTNLYMFNALYSLKPDINPSLLINKTLLEFLNNYFPARLDLDGNVLPQVVIFDQLEELFNLFPERWQEAQEVFFRQVSEVVKNNSFRRIIFVIREEFLAQLDPFARILPDELRFRYRLDRLRQDAAILAIRGPLERIGYVFDTSEIERIVKDLLKMRVETFDGKSIEITGEFVEPIQLQVVCSRWWHDLKSTSAEQTGQNDVSILVDGALQDLYEEGIHEASKQTGISENTIRNWFEEMLITSSGTRGVVHKGSNLSSKIPNFVLDILENKHLIKGEWRSGARWYELTHDPLIGPIRNSNEQWNMNREDTIKKASSIFSRATHLMTSGKYEKVLKLYYQALDMGKKVEEWSIAINALINIANVYENQENYPEALKYYFDALKMSKEKMAIDHQIISLANIADTYYHMKDYNKSIGYYSQVEELDPLNKQYYKSRRELAYWYSGRFSEPAAHNVDELYHILNENFVRAVNEILENQPDYLRSISRLRNDYAQMAKKTLETTSSFQNQIIKKNRSDNILLPVYYSGQLVKQSNTLAVYAVKIIDNNNWLTVRTTDIAIQNLKLYNKMANSMIQFTLGMTDVLYSYFDLIRQRL